ncbi:Molydopterin dinucleotide binding domain-containing protein [Amycolatopsis xylanica]|uniref:Molydopterin dinucleotide binding domain-containing protein n=1 Tax=Amycolatopsis xylanica TaxID=589385 RepID=A0A1H2VDZ6_9PSEU|nr:nitrate reductase [Amycolatopsis xylanica]SDW66548.1 Molydopterin dinucleotide binding domain-containing protein [Amycolatopsis xylanica]
MAHADDTARTPYGPGEPWPSRVDSFLTVDESEVDTWVPTAAVLHSNGDGLDLAVSGGRIAGVRGRAGDRVNHGRLDPKDRYGWQANNAPDRLTRPLVRRDGRLVESDWDTAMDLIAERTKHLLAERGPGSVGFYTSGQLFLEEYYTLAAIARGAIGTPHLDGNTRLCTATAAAALKESFGSDGQPGSYGDIDHADTIVLYGHNVAETQAVLWERMLDRLAGPNPPALICVDPRTTRVAEHATVHLAPFPGTNLALMNGLLHELIEQGWAGHDYVAEHTVGYADLAAQVESYTPERVARICRLPAERIREAAEIIGRAERLTSTVLQGFYQSNQATASAVQVNNIHLLRGMLGRPGRGVFQMNGQPTAQNTRECGADGDLPGFRNWANDAHVEELARLWNVDASHIPHDGPPTHAMEIFALAGKGELGMLWVSATNPAVSMPDLARIRSILGKDELFLVVQDIFPTETTAFADVVLPAAAWGEKTGAFTNADRTVHYSGKAVDPPGQARPDLDIFLDFARRMDFRDNDGKAFPHWHDTESAFHAWQDCSAGRPCDYTGLSHAKLRGEGIQWPLGTERLYGDGRFPAAPSYCEDFGHDLISGDPVDAEAYAKYNPDGKAMLKAAGYLPPPEQPSEDYPFALITGRTLHHFHTRTKTGRVEPLTSAAPDVWVELSHSDARAHGITEGDPVELRSPRGLVRATAKISAIRDGVLFLPFHYGYWDSDRHDDRAANELTLTTWDPVSKQPLFKTAAVSLARGRPGPHDQGV